MTSSFATGIQGLIDHRRDAATRLGPTTAWWETASSLIDRAIERGRVALADRSLTPELTDALRDARLEELSVYARDSLMDLLEVRHRLERPTINIGVSGRARVGKSSILQTLSGLSDQEIPTGSGLPVTAVRSRIFHTSGQPGATIAFHSETSFLEEVIAPYYEYLNLGAPPRTVGLFASASFSDKFDRRPESERQLLSRLEEMRAAGDSYSALLRGDERRVALAELRPFVAYPKEQGPHVARPYLAVRDVRIDCPFPRGDVGDIGLLDLPGLGEVAEGTQRRHVKNVRDDVDVVLLLKRPVEGLAYWDDQDMLGLGLLEQASAPVEAQDFILILVNSAESDGEYLRETLVHDLERRFVERTGPFQLLQADAMSRDDVDENVLNPVLAHLIKRLPSMDSTVVSYAIRACEPRRQALQRRTSSLAANLRTPLSRSSHEELGVAARSLRENLAAELQGVVEQLRSRTYGAEEDDDYIVAVTAAYDLTKAWIGDAFGVGRDEWLRQALGSLRVHQGSGPFTTEHLNAVRVEIGRRFTTIDTYFASQLDSLLLAVATVMRQQLGAVLVPETSPRAALIALRDNLLTADEAAPVVAQALEDLLDLRLDYRAQLHPRVRVESDLLMPITHDLETNGVRDTVSAEASPAGAEVLLREISHLAEQVAHRTRQALLREAVLPARVLYAAAEQFEDAVIRSLNSEVEFARISRSFRDDIWPGRFSTKESAALRVREVQQACRELIEHLTTHGDGAV